MSWFLTSRMLRTWRPSWRRLVTRGLVGMRKAGRRTTFSTVSNANCPFELQLRTGAPLRGALSAIHRGQRARERDGQKARDATVKGGRLGEGPTPPEFVAVHGDDGAPRL